MPLQVRYGLTDRIQLFAALPVGWTNTETAEISSTLPVLRQFLEWRGTGRCQRRFFLPGPQELRVLLRSRYRGHVRIRGAHQQHRSL